MKMNPNRARVNFKTFVSKKWIALNRDGRTERDGGRTDRPLTQKFQKLTLTLFDLKGIIPPDDPNLKFLTLKWVK